MKNWIIIPTYNEAENITSLIPHIFQQGISDLCILVVDDNSPDKTGDMVRKMQSEFENLHLISREKKDGLGGAYKAGFAFALEKNAEYIFEMDADFSHKPEDLIRLLTEAQKGADLVIGSRKIKGGRVEGWNAWRHFCSNGAMFFSRIILGLKTKDLTAGFRCFRANVLKEINYQTIVSNGYAFQEELLYRLEKQNFKIKEIPVVFPDRQKGESKLGISDIIEFFKTVLKLRFKS
jgi:dolichol-phosphate mannosyltransferase